MKIYGYTIVDTLGYDDGTESFTKLFTSEEERDNTAYEAYEAEYDYTESEHDYNIEQEFLAKEEFLTEFKKNYVFFVREDSHFQIESWEAEI